MLKKFNLFFLLQLFKSLKEIEMKIIKNLNYLFFEYPFDGYMLETIL